MKKLTAEWCEYLLKDLQQKSVTGCGISLKEERYMQALEIALPILEQQERSEEDWIEWDGGKRSVDGSANVEVKFRDGFLSKGPAYLYRWKFAKEGNWHWASQDIIAYRIIPVQT